MSYLQALADAAAVARAMVRRADLVARVGSRVAIEPDPERPAAVRQAVAAVEAIALAEHHYEAIAALADTLLPIERRDLAAHLLNSIARDSGQRRAPPTTKNAKETP